MIRAAAFAFGVLLVSSPALALEGAGLVGDWETQWSNAADEPLSGGGPLLIRPDSGPDRLDGVTAAPGFDGVMNGEVSEQEDGALVWSGAWVSIWPEGATRGTFRFVFTDAQSFTGVWSSEDGEVENARWEGRRIGE